MVWGVSGCNRGANTLWESVYNGWVTTIVLDMMGGMGWHGVAMGEFKLDTNGWGAYVD